MPNQYEEEIENKVPNAMSERNLSLKGSLLYIRKRIKSNYPKQG
jgi:hypothetical protein